MSIDFETLKREDAIALWRKGRDAWNAWVKDNSDYNIDFSGADFSKYNIVNFTGFNFPNGHIYFINATFGEGNVLFNHTNFGKGNIYFNDTNFGRGNVFFNHTNFGKGNVYFNHADFEAGDVFLGGATFNGRVFFTDLKIKTITGFSFKYATFDGPFDLSSKEIFPCLIDLTYTKMSHHLCLSQVKCTLNRTPQKQPIFGYNSDWMTHHQANNKNDIARARRLKELSENNKDHLKAKEFHILEMQAARTFKKPRLSFLANTEFWYELLSNYGQSITRPLYALLSLWFVFSLAYGGLYTVKGFSYSAAQMFGFIPGSRIIQDYKTDLFDEKYLDFVYFLTSFQSGMSIILLFLLGLGLRHKYKI